MEIKISPGCNQGPMNVDKDFTGQEKNNQQQLLADTTEIETFFKALFCNATGGYVSLRGFHHEGGVAFNAESYLFDNPGLLSAANRLATHAASLPGAVFCSPTATFKESSKAKEIDVFNGVALSVDLDETHPEKAREVLETILGPPTIVVASGGIWQEPQTNSFFSKLHLHWRLARPTITSEEHEQLNNLRKLAAKIVKGDSSAGPLAHPMRLPGSWHTKSLPKMCKILDCKNDVEISLEYAKERLENHQKEQEDLINRKVNFKSSREDNTRGKENNTEYGKKALFEEVCNLSNALEGERNSRLNRAAFCLGQLVANGDLEENYVINSLLSTALCIGLKQSEAYQTVQSGLNAGKSKPRTSSEQERPQKILSTAGQKFPFIKASDLKITHPQWIVEDYLEENSLSVIFGDPGSGKTFIALSLAVAVAIGCSWYNRSVKQGSVFYIAGEGHSGISRRLAAWSKYHECPLDRAPLFISERPAQFLDRANAMLVAQTIQELADIHGPPKLVVIDTLARNFGNGNENQTEDMSAFIAIVDACIRIPFNCCVLIVHHTGHNEKDRARGSIALKGAADSEYNIGKQKDILTMTTTKMKEAEILEPLSFLLKTVEIGIVDEKNREVTSAILESTRFVNSNLEKIRDLIPAEGINQTKLLEKMNETLEIAQASGTQLLKDGVGKYWNITKGTKNANIYLPFFSFSNPKEQETEKQKEDEKCTI